jgi:hypothetical protein
MKDACVRMWLISCLQKAVDAVKPGGTIVLIIILSDKTQLMLF